MPKSKQKRRRDWSGRKKREKKSRKRGIKLLFLHKKGYLRRKKGSELSSKKVAQTVREGESPGLTVPMAYVWQMSCRVLAHFRLLHVAILRLVSLETRPFYF